MHKANFIRAYLIRDEIIVATKIGERDLTAITKIMETIKSSTIILVVKGTKFWGMLSRDKKIDPDLPKEEELESSL